MTFVKYIRKLEHIDFLISCEITGSPIDFANKLGVKRSTLFKYLKDLRSLGVDIKFSYARQTYYYANNNRISSIFRGDPISNEVMKDTIAGCIIDHYIGNNTKLNYYIGTQY